MEDIFQAFFSAGGFGFEVRRGPMRGQDLLHTVEISAVEAMLGAKVVIPTGNGGEENELPAGTQHGTRYALRGRGLPGSNGGPPGDLVIGVRVVVPTALDEKQRELAEKLNETLEPRNIPSQQEGELLHPGPQGIRLRGRSVPSACAP